MIYDVGGQGEYLQIGTIGRARGLKGHVRVRPFTDDPGRFYDLEQIFLLENGVYATLDVEEADVNGEAVHLKFRGVDDREHAERLNGKSLFVRRRDAIKPPPGAFFITDIIGCAVRDETGHFLGTIAEVMQPGATDVYVLRGGPDGEIMFPALKSVILATDVQAKTMSVDAKRFQEVAVRED